MLMLTQDGFLGVVELSPAQAIEYVVEHQAASEVIPLLEEKWGREVILAALSDGSEGWGITAMSQRNAQWASDVLGHSGGYWRIGNGGCALTSVAMVASQWDKTITPASLNRALKATPGGFNGAELNWEAVDAVVPELYRVERYDWNYPVPVAALDTARDLVDRYGPIIAEVDFKPKTSAQEQHFVVVLEVTDTDMRIIDPWDGAETWLMLRYASEGQDLARALWGVRAFEHKEDE